MFRKRNYFFALLCALFIAVLLLLAASSKLFPWSTELSNFSWVIALFEIFFSVFLVVCHRKWEVWLFAACVFALWAGYALFWVYEGLPCGCLGDAFHPPTGTTLLCDVLFIVIALGVAGRWDRAPTQTIKGVLAFLPLLIVIGFLIARQIVFPRLYGV